MWSSVPLPKTSRQLLNACSLLNLRLALCKSITSSLLSEKEAPPLPISSIPSPVWLTHWLPLTNLCLNFSWSIFFWQNLDPNMTHLSPSFNSGPSPLLSIISMGISLIMRFGLNRVKPLFLLRLPMPTLFLEALFPVVVEEDATNPPHLLVVVTPPHHHSDLIVAGGEEEILPMMLTQFVKCAIVLVMWLFIVIIASTTVTTVRNLLLCKPILVLNRLLLIQIGTQTQVQPIISHQILQISMFTLRNT